MADPRRIRAALSIVAALFVLAILWQARVALLPFMVGAIIAILISPFVDFVAARLRFRRLSEHASVRLSITLVYAATLGVLALVLVFLVPSTIDAIEDLVERQEEIYNNVSERVIELILFYEDNAPDFIQERVEEGVAAFGDNVNAIVANALTRVVDIVADSFSVAAGFIIIPVWLAYVLPDRAKARDSFQRLFPESWRPDVAAITSHSTNLLTRYVRVQLLLGIIVGLLSWIGLTALGVPHAVPLSIILGVTELILIIGPIIGGLIAILVTLAADPGWTVLWVLLLVVGIQQIENLVLVPRLQGVAIRMHPAMIIMLLIVAGQVFGLFGLIVALPVAAVLRDAFVHIHRRLGEATVESSS